MTPQGSRDRGSGSFPQRVGDYEIVGELARGGQGVVYQGRTEGGRSLAVKVLLDTDARSRARFEQEAKVLAGLRHPHLPRMHDFGHSQGRLFMSMEYVEGQDLREWVKSTGTLPIARATEVLSVIAAALHYCHTQGVVHRDLKPANIMIERGTERPVLVDFGLLKRDASQHGELTLAGISRLSLSGEIKGTPGYMAPEQADPSAHGPATVATDVYALGATLYYALTGQAPFRGSSAINTINKLLHDPAPDPRQLNGQVPAALAKLCQAAMAKDPAARPPSAAAFARQLLSGNDASAAESPGRGAKGRVWGGLAVLVGLLTAIGIVATRPAVDAASPTPLVTVESESARATPAAKPRLWALEPGDSFTLVYELSEINAFREARVEFDFSATVGAAGGEGAVELSCELVAVRGGFGDGTNRELISGQFDSRRPNPGVLAALAGAVGKVLTLRLDRVHGGVSDVEGLQAMRTAVLEGEFIPSSLPAFDPERIKDYLRAALSEQHVQQAFDALMHLGDDPTRRVPWSRVVEGRQFLSAKQSEAYALAPLSSFYAPGEEHRFDLSGEAEFKDGRLVSAKLEQIMGLAGEGSLAPLPESRRMEIQLELTLEDFRSAAGE